MFLLAKKKVPEFFHDAKVKRGVLKVWWCCPFSKLRMLIIEVEGSCFTSISI